MRTYFYDIDRTGRLTHEGTILTDEKFLNFFFKRLKKNDTGIHEDYPFVSPCGNEMNYIRCEDTPIVFTRRVGRKLVYAPGLEVPFEPRGLRFSEMGVLYHAAPAGDVGRIDSELTLELGRSIDNWGPYYAYRGEDGKNVVIEPLEPQANWIVLHSRPENECFGCGGANAFGLGLSFLFDSEARIARSWLQPEDRLQGGPGRMHGGFIALLLDEVMAKVLTGMGLSGACPTAHMDIDFRRPVDLNQPIELFARLESQQGRKYRLQGEIRRPAPTPGEAGPAPESQPEAPGIILAEARALYVKVMDAQTSLAGS